MLALDECTPLPSLPRVSVDQERGEACVLRFVVVGFQQLAVRILWGPFSSFYRMSPFFYWIWAFSSQRKPK